MTKGDTVVIVIAMVIVIITNINVVLNLSQNFPVSRGGGLLSPYPLRVATARSLADWLQNVRSPLENQHMSHFFFPCLWAHLGPIKVGIIFMILLRESGLWDGLLVKK